MFNNLVGDDDTGVQLLERGSYLQSNPPDLLSVARQRNGDQFDKRLQRLFKPEIDAAERSVQTGLSLS